MAMKKILVANQKGGCGKTMVAINLASAISNHFSKLTKEGEAAPKIVLADADQQKSSIRWLKQRPADVAGITGVFWRTEKNIGQVPDDTDWLIIDAPGALRGEHAEQLISECKAIITPVLPSFFDADSSKRFLKEIEDIKRVRKGKVQVHLIANRIRSQSKQSQKLQDFFEQIGQQPLAWISERSAYPQLAAEGLSIFDKTQKLYQPMQEQWQPILDAILSE